MSITRIAVIGAGDISDVYLKNLTQLYSEISVAGIYSRTEERARAQADRYGIPRVYGTLEELLDDPSTSIVLNLTPPQEHFTLSMRCLEAGKHVYTEKAMAATLEQGRVLLETARKNHLTICGAPDTFLTAGYQTLRKLADDGWIGKVTGATVSVMLRGHEAWHMNPAFFYREGGGPMMDMGVYPLTALVNLFGSVATVAGMCTIAFAERIITSQPLYGTKIQVETPTQIMGLLRFENGVTASIITGFDSCAGLQNQMMIYGAQGALRMSAYGGPVSLLQPDRGEFLEMPLLFPYPKHVHGLGLADQASAIAKGRKPRASGELIFHVLEVMKAVERSGISGEFVEIASRVERPNPMKEPALLYMLDE